MNFGILGSLDVRSAGIAVDLGGATPRRLLSILLLPGNHGVSSDRVIELLWAGEPPATALNTVQVHVAALRRALRRAEPEDALERIDTVGGGYRLRIEPGELDADVFEELFADARARSSEAPEIASALARRALDLWRGDVLADVALPADLAPNVGRLEAVRAAAVELSFELRIRLGEAGGAAAELRPLVDADPTNEPLLALLMLALYRSGRQVDALAAYRAGRRQLVDELGLDPGPELRRLEQAILRQDPDLWLAPLPPAAVPDAAASIDALPAEPNAFVGRKSDLDELSMLIETGHRLVTITGIGGSGKSRLALRLARGVAARFPDGVRWVDLAPIATGDQVGEAIAIGVGIREQPGRPVFDSLIAGLRERGTAVVIDNCEPFQWHAAHAIETLLRACPGLVVIATSREPLGLAGEEVWPLGGLALPDAATTDVDELRRSDAIALFLERGRSASPNRTVSDDQIVDVANVVRRLDGLPLAIEMGAAWLRVISPAEITARLADRERLLGLAGGTTESRHRSLQATFDSSFDLLTSPQRTLFARLSVFAGAVSAEAVDAVCGEDLADVGASLAALVDRSLVVAVPSRAETRYRLLDTIREYGRLKLHDAGDDEKLLARHVRWATTVAEEAYRRRISDEPNAIRDLGEHIDELRLALDRAPGLGPEIGPHLAGFLAWYWPASGRVNDGRAVDEQALRDATSQVDRGRLLVGLGSLETFSGHPAPGIAALEEAKSIWQSLGEGAEECLARSSLGWAHFWPGHNDEALAAFMGGVAIAERLGDSDLRLRLMAGACQTYAAMGDAAAALPMARQLLEIARPGDVRTTHFAHHFLADCALLAGDAATAAREYTTALELALVLDDRLEIGVELQGVAMAQAGLGRSREGVLIEDAAEASLERLGVAVTVPFWLGQLDRWIAPARAAVTSDAGPGAPPAPPLSVSEAVALVRSLAEGDSSSGA